MPVSRRCTDLCTPSSHLIAIRAPNNKAVVGELSSRLQTGNQTGRDAILFLRISSRKSTKGQLVLSYGDLFIRACRHFFSRGEDPARNKDAFIPPEILSFLSRNVSFV